MVLYMLARKKKAKNKKTLGILLHVPGPGHKNTKVDFNSTSMSVLCWDFSSISKTQNVPSNKSTINCQNSVFYLAACVFLECWPFYPDCRIGLDFDNVHKFNTCFTRSMGNLSQPRWYQWTGLIKCTLVKCLKVNEFCHEENHAKDVSKLPTPSSIFPYNLLFLPTPSARIC